VSDQFYLRVKGNVTGPVDRGQLEALIRRGRFARHNELSEDQGMTWFRASQYPELFQAKLEAKKRKTPPKQQEVALQEPIQQTEEAVGVEATPNTDENVWFFAKGDEQIGPVSIADAKVMLISGNLSVDDFAWKEGFPEWVPVNTVPEMMQTESQSASVVASTVQNQSSGQASSAATMSLIFGILSLSGLFFIGSFPAIIFGNRALSEIKFSDGQLEGRNYAVAGIIMGYVSIGLTVIGLVIGLIISIVTHFL
jgi:hypothetical protein